MIMAEVMLEDTCSCKLLSTNVLEENKEDCNSPTAEHLFIINSLGRSHCFMCENSPYIMAALKTRACLWASVCVCWGECGDGGVAGYFIDIGFAAEIWWQLNTKNSALPINLIWSRLSTSKTVCFVSFSSSFHWGHMTILSQIQMYEVLFFFNYYLNAWEREKKFCISSLTKKKEKFSPTLVGCNWITPECVCLRLCVAHPA